ncbi:MAG: hypothetical protein A3H69_00355 [Candidatus Sungbacteria bacterium RIFCSPLOWO2_02_FULL_47_9]|uniref:Uncharacterized protein n=1 Tax=Candidatus Sungbacteria bacterium RIFCSPHIGHO2_01_FULL_47_32 TaxID=1802264 RepID=A0A1G2K445_9BACT|nr:MAG: hypothetical protein A2633_02950 [Candidatus Sungbacteria bacterium RIFCSPHIGHO2_01_FULL_47_32]OHA00014.1 MAG: hypothetical protein A3D57_03755 [Candidatus Sungbacteria bacterium RIFCSPHIGHO2_02_FULL_46_12]OHA06254.1 MAG: hypothetical protein A3A28_02055 [Candidatus Sungbacteria bacterium RIFCSPLOWO2_01_FULL_47_32]OHA09785.1 MAG: hypothetical protein A3H69_00355 [Candidatus Sungbacteria bacterium RIFCSPLOWO2_02_FULL_47_9]
MLLLISALIKKGGEKGMKKCSILFIVLFAWWFGIYSGDRAVSVAGPLESKGHCERAQQKLLKTTWYYQIGEETKTFPGAVMYLSKCFSDEEE